jgi:hypothetical protein
MANRKEKDFYDDVDDKECDLDREFDFDRDFEPAPP